MFMDNGSCGKIRNVGVEHPHPFPPPSGERMKVRGRKYKISPLA